MIRARTIICADSPWISVCHRHGAEREALARRQLFGRAFELSASGKNIASPRRAHRRGIARGEHDLREFFDLPPIGALAFRAGPRIKRDQIDLRGYPSKQ